MNPDHTACKCGSRNADQLSEIRAVKSLKPPHQQPRWDKRKTGPPNRGKGQSKHPDRRKKHHMCVAADAFLTHMPEFHCASFERRTRCCISLLRLLDWVSIASAPGSKTHRRQQIWRFSWQVRRITLCWMRAFCVKFTETIDSASK